MSFFELLIRFVFDAYIFALLLRLLLQKLGANWHNPLSQIIIKLTEPIIKPLQRFFPGYKGFDFAVVFPLFALELVKVVLLLFLKTQIMPGASGIVVISVASLGNKLANLYFWSILLSVIITWVPALQHNPIAGIVQTVANPPMVRASQFVPRVAGIDLSPILLILLLKAVELLIFQPLFVFGLKLAY